MAGYGDIRTGRRGVFGLYAHPVAGTKYRHQVFTPPHLERTEEITRDVRADSGAEPREFHGARDHAHTLGNSRGHDHLPPRQQPQTQVLPTLRRESPEPRRHHWRAKRPWPGSCFAGSVGGAPITALRHYIEQHNHPS